jgi:CheY-like chemotaxis protein
MTQPLALVFYERLLPGSQLVNRMQDLKYKVRTVTDLRTLVACAQREKPMLVLTDAVSTKEDVCAAIRRLKQTAETRHIPIIAFAPDNSGDLEAAVRSAGATLVTNDAALLSHLHQLLEQALQVE